MWAMISRTRSRSADPHWTTSRWSPLWSSTEVNPAWARRVRTRAGSSPSGTTHDTVCASGESSACSVSVCSIPKRRIMRISRRGTTSTVRTSKRGCEHHGDSFPCLPRCARPRSRHEGPASHRRAGRPGSLPGANNRDVIGITLSRGCTPCGPRHGRYPMRTLVTATALALCTSGLVPVPSPGRRRIGSDITADTTTPIEHLVVVFQENASFDHYFGTYPLAANPPGDPPFTARTDTPTVNNLLPSALNGNRDLRVTNPNAAMPFRLDRSQFITCSQSHTYRPEERAANLGRMDRFVQATDNSGLPPSASGPVAAGDGLLRRQHRDRPVELRPALRPGGQRVRHHLRAVDPGRAQPGRRPDVGCDLQHQRRQGRHRGHRLRRSRPAPRRLRRPAAKGHRQRTERR